MTKIFYDLSHAQQGGADASLIGAKMAVIL